MKRWHKTKDIQAELKELSEIVVSPVFDRISQHIENLEQEIKELKERLNEQA